MSPAESPMVAATSTWLTSGPLSDWLPAGFAPYIPELALAAALAWGAGIRLYAVVFLFGLAHAMGWWTLPPHLQVLAHPLVIGTAAFMALVELFADKVPFLDTMWDAVHTFIRIPAGAALAASVFGDAGVATAVAAALLGGTLTATTHLAKSGARAVTNTSPEPVSNIAVSSTEDLMVPAGLWLAVQYPLAFLVLLALFLLAAVAGMVFLVRGVRRLLQARRRRAGARGASPP